MSHRFISTQVSRFAAYGRSVGCRCRCHINRAQGQTISSRKYVVTRSWSEQHKKWSSRQLQDLSKVLVPAEDYPCQSDSSYFKSKHLIGPPACRQRIDFLIPQAAAWVCVRYFHSSLGLGKEVESKVEQSVKALKEAVLVKSQGEKGVVPDTKAKGDMVVKKPLGQRIINELKHYYHGFRLLFIDIRICIRLLWAMLNGKTLTRRERRQMVRTTADMFRLVPFLVFLVVPFMEFLLPVAVKLFPNMLPSTFQEEDKEKEKLKKQLKLKLEMAKFLQDTVNASALQSRKDTGEGTVREFADFMQRVRQEGTQPSMAEVTKFSKLFEDEITMEHLGRGTLQALCRVLGIAPIGPDNLLRFQLRMKLRQLKTDDRIILREGIDTLSIGEVQAACRVRGMRSLGVPEDRLRFQLKQWIDMHLNERIPTSLLLLSRALYLPETLSTAEQLKATLSQLPEASVAEGALKAAELAGAKLDNKAKLDIIKSEEEAIKEEKKREQEEEEEKKRLEEQLAAEAEEQAKQELKEEAVTFKPQPSEELKDPETLTVTDRIEKTTAEKLEEEEEEVITSKDLEEIETAIEQIADKMKISIEKEELKDLKEEVSDYKEDLADLKEVVVLVNDPETHIEESKAAQRLMKRVDKLISQADTIIDKLHYEKEKFQEDMEVKEVRVKRSRELQGDKERMERIMQEIDLNKDNIISINEMVLALKRLQKIPDETRALKILEILDEDKDGKIDINTVMKVIEELGRENVKLSKTQITEVVDLLKREGELEQEEKQKKEEKQKEKEEMEKLKESGEMAKEDMTPPEEQEGSPSSPHLPGTPPARSAPPSPPPEKQPPSRP